MLRNFFNSHAIRQTVASTHKLPGSSNLWIFFGVAVSNAALQNAFEQRVNNYTQQIEIRHHNPK